MLRQRIITALVLLALLLPALFAPVGWPFAAFTLALISAGAWEWGRLNGGAGAPAVALGIVLAAACVAAIVAGWAKAAPAALWWMAVPLWALLGGWGLSRGPSAWPRLPAALRWLLGLAVLWLAWLAIVNARSVGINFLLSALCLVWAADIAAYFGGRAFGRRKLAPSISPGKSWEGVCSGMLGALALAALWLWLDSAFVMDSPSLYRRLVDGMGLTAAAAVVILLCGLSVVGDLFESLVKRSVGVKDSSGLLPGHGGVLDRFDALLPVMPIALALSST